MCSAEGWRMIGRKNGSFVLFQWFDLGEDAASGMFTTEFRGAGWGCVSSMSRQEFIKGGVGARWSHDGQSLKDAGIDMATLAMVQPDGRMVPLEWGTA